MEHVAERRIGDQRRRVDQGADLLRLLNPGQFRYVPPGVEAGADQIGAAARTALLALGVDTGDRRRMIDVALGASLLAFLAEDEEVAHTAAGLLTVLLPGETENRRAV